MTFLNPYTKALLCENARLEEIMNIPISEILDYKSRADSVNPEDALRYLADMYVDNCGISRGLRVFADYCALFWVERLTAQQNNMNDAESNVSFFDLLSKFSAKYTTGHLENSARMVSESSENIFIEIQLHDNKWLIYISRNIYR